MNQIKNETNLPLLIKPLESYFKCSDIEYSNNKIFIDYPSFIIKYFDDSLVVLNTITDRYKFISKEYNVIDDKLINEIISIIQKLATIIYTDGDGNVIDRFDLKFNELQFNYQDSTDRNRFFKDKKDLEFDIYNYGDNESNLNIIEEQNIDSCDLFDFESETYMYSDSVIAFNITEIITATKNNN